MKNTAVVINVARGGIINEEDLDWALEQKEIGGAGLDCMTGEPVSKDCPLFRHENLIVTPHMAWYSEEARPGTETQGCGRGSAVCERKGDPLSD